MRLFYGVDIGGTNVKAGIVDETGRICCQSSQKSRAGELPPEAILDIALNQLERLTQELGSRREQIVAAGVGSPGVIDKSRRTIVRAFNLPFINLKAADYLEARLHLPVTVGNDANLAALAESRIGAGKGAVSSVTVTLGTGVGGGVIINDRVYSGFNGAGCELGHVVLVQDGIPCTCGRRGCIESYCSAAALIRQTIEAGLAEPESILGRFMASGGKVTGRTAFELAAEGCRTAARVVAQYERYVGEALASYINALNPERLILGGGISHQGPAFVEAVAKVALAEAFILPEVEAPVITAAIMGNDAGIVGAAMFAMDNLNCLPAS